MRGRRRYGKEQWNERQIRRLTEMSLGGDSVARMAECVAKTESAVRTKLEELGIGPLRSRRKVKSATGS